MTYRDQMGNSVDLMGIPQRIVSLVPSQTELLIDLGLDDRVIGRTNFCIHPADKVKNVEVIGGTKKFRFDKIEELNPDLIIGNKEENYEEGIRQLQEKYPLWMSDISDLTEALYMITSLGEITGAEEKAIHIVAEIQGAFDRLKTRNQGKALYLIWNKPYMAAGKGTFIDHILDRAGFENVVHAPRYPEVGEKDFHEADHILLSSEPFPFSEEHISIIRDAHPDKSVRIVDGEMFSWYGSRLRLVSEYISDLTANF